MKEATGYQTIKEASLKFVEAMKISGKPCAYRKEPGGDESFYGAYHAAHILDMFGELKNLSKTQRNAWTEYLDSQQTDHGFFASSPERYQRPLKGRELDPVWHYTRGHLWTYRILDERAKKPLAFLGPFMDGEFLYRYIKSYDWGNPWAVANQVLALATALFALRDWEGVSEVDKLLENFMFPALQELQDHNTGYWGTQFGAGLSNGLFGTIHLLPIYLAQGWPLGHIRRMVGSTIKCQRPDGAYWPGGSDCPDFDGAYMLSNLYVLTDYRKEEIGQLSRKLMDYLLMHQDPSGLGWLLHRRDSLPTDWAPRPHFIWRENAVGPQVEWRDADPGRTHIMLGSWFYPLAIAMISQALGDTGFEGSYRLNPLSLHQCHAINVPLTTAP